MDPNNEEKNPAFPTEDVLPTSDPTPEVPTTEPIVPATPFFTDANTSSAPELSPEAAAPVAPLSGPDALATAPQEPTPNVIPATPFTPGEPVPEPPKKNTKKIILIASVAAGVVLLAIIAIVIFLFLTTVSKADYRDAAKQFNQVTSASSSLNSDVSSLGASSGSTSDSDFEKSLKDTQDSLDTIKNENESLSKLKAVRVGEGGDLYKTFDDKLDAYLAYGNDLVASVKNLRPAMVACDKVSDADDAAARVAALKTCATSLNDVKDLPNAEFKTFVTELATAYTSYAKTYEGISALTNPYGTQYEQYKTLRDEMYATQDKISAASKTFQESLEKRDDELSVKASADALADYLTEQQR